MLRVLQKQEVKPEARNRLCVCARASNYHATEQTPSLPLVSGSIVNLGRCVSGQFRVCFKPPVSRGTTTGTASDTKTFITARVREGT